MSGHPSVRQRTVNWAAQMDGVAQGFELTLPVGTTATSLALPGALSFEDWKKTGEALSQCERAVMWWLGDWWLHGERSYGEAAAQAAATGYSAETLRKAAWICSSVESVLRRTDLSFQHHELVAALPPPEQSRLLRAAVENDWTVAELRQEVRKRKHADKIAPPLPSNKYGVIYCDPPWEYEFSATDSRKIENQYPTMAADEIARMPVRELAHADCVLFMWATSPKLEEALRVIEAWGFEYKTCAVWDKQVIGMGYYFRQQHELLLVATVGAPSAPDAGCRVSSVFSYQRGKHSAKPAPIRAAIERMYPDAPKIELFSRSETPGWAAWGNENARAA